MKLPIGIQERRVNGIEELNGTLFFGFDLEPDDYETAWRKYYSYAELRAIPGNLDELMEWVCAYDWLKTTKELMRSHNKEHWEHRSKYWARLYGQIDRALLDFEVYPSEVFLQIANGILELAKREVEIRIAVAESELEAAA